MIGNHITVTEPNGVTRTKPLTARGLTIGRGDDNDLMIAYAAVSRHHAQVAFDTARGRYYVTDLNSANGTYLSNVRLEPNTPTVWVPGQPLRIGDVLIHLKRTARPAPKVETRAKNRLEPVSRTESDTLIGLSLKGDRIRNGKGKSRSFALVLIALVALLLLAVLCAATIAVYYFLL